MAYSEDDDDDEYTPWYRTNQAVAGAGFLGVVLIAILIYSVVQMSSRSEQPAVYIPQTYPTTTTTTTTTTEATSETTTTTSAP